MGGIKTWGWVCGREQLFTIGKKKGHVVTPPKGKPHGSRMSGGGGKKKKQSVTQLEEGRPVCGETKASSGRTTKQKNLGKKREQDTGQKLG